MLNWKFGTYTDCLKWTFLFFYLNHGYSCVMYCFRLSSGLPQPHYRWWRAGPWRRVVLQTLYICYSCKGKPPVIFTTTSKVIHSVYYKGKPPVIVTTAVKVTLNMWHTCKGNSVYFTAVKVTLYFKQIIIKSNIFLV